MLLQLLLQSELQRECWQTALCTEMLSKAGLHLCQSGHCQPLIMPCSTLAGDSTQLTHVQ